MKKNILLLALVLSLGFLAGCSSEPAETVISGENEGTILVGEVTGAGSTSVEPIAVATGEEFMAINPGVDFTYEGIGSSAGVTKANERVTHFGAASRNLKSSETEFGLTVKTIAYDGIAVIVHPANDLIDELTKEEVKAIYKGEISNWAEVGGADQLISVVSREDGSGTRAAFEEIVGFEEKLRADALLKDGNGNVQATVAGNEQAIGYVSFSYLDDSIKAVKIDGSLPTVENVLKEEYPVARPFLMFYHEENINEATKAYLEFVMSPAGQEVVEAEGGIPIN